MHNVIHTMDYYQFSSVQFSCSVVSNSLWSHGLQHSRPPCPSPTPEACSDSCPSSQWCRPTISSSVVPFFCPQSFPASGSFLMSQLFASGGQSIGASTSVLVSGTITPGLTPLWDTHGVIHAGSRGDRDEKHQMLLELAAWWWRQWCQHEAQRDRRSDQGKSGWGQLSCCLMLWCGLSSSRPRAPTWSSGSYLPQRSGSRKETCDLGHWVSHLRGGGGCQHPGARDPGGRGTQPTHPASPPRWPEALLLSDRSR